MVVEEKEDIGPAFKRFKKMKSFAVFAALTFIKIVIAANVETVNQDIVVDNIERSINLESQLVKINSKVTLTNNGKGATKGFHYAVEESMAPHVSYIGATVNFLAIFFERTNRCTYFNVICINNFENRRWVVRKRHT